MREVGMAFRSLVTCADDLRTLTYAKARDIVVRYEKAVGPHHKDLPSIQDILKKMRDCPKMSRFQWCSCVRSLCDETLLNDFVSTVDSITASEDGSMDMGNSLDPVEEGLQLVAQDRSLPQKRMVIAKKLAAMKSFCTEEVK